MSRVRRVLVLLTLGTVAACSSSSPSGTTQATQSSPGVAASSGASTLPGIGASPITVPTTAPAEDFAVLADVEFVNRDDGWVAGNGLILHTADGGRHWHRQYFGDAHLQHLDMLDTAHGWAVGTAELLSTTDGGAHWRQAGDPTTRLRWVAFIDARLGYGVAGGDGFTGGELMRSTDGGLHWHAVTSPQNPQTVCFGSRNDGWLGADGYVYSTQDGGRSWQLRLENPGLEPGNTEQPPPSFLTRVQCAPGNVAWAALDAGHSIAGSESQAAYRLTPTSTTPLFAGGPDRLYGTDGAGRPPGPASGPFSRVDADNAAFVGQSPEADPPVVALMLVSHGSDRHSPLMIGGLQLAQAASFVSSSRGWVLGGTQPAQPSEWRIVATVDGGRSWHTQLDVRIAG